MNRIKTILGMFAIGFLTYIYIEDFPIIAKKIQSFIFKVPEKHIKDEIKKEAEENRSSEYKPLEREKSSYRNYKQEKIFKPIDKYERKAEEEIDRLLELK